MAGPGRYNDVTEKRDYLQVMDDDEARRLRRGYYAAVSFIDSLIGELVAELKYLRLDDDTIVSIHGDHGWQLGEVGLRRDCVNTPKIEKNHNGFVDIHVWAHSTYEAVEDFVVRCQARGK